MIPTPGEEALLEGEPEDVPYFEIEGLGPHDPEEDEMYPNAHKPSRITFSSGPIRVRLVD